MKGPKQREKQYSGQILSVVPYQINGNLTGYFIGLNTVTGQDPEIIHRTRGYYITREVEPNPLNDCPATVAKEICALEVAKARRKSVTLFTIDDHLSGWDL